MNLDINFLLMYNLVEKYKYLFLYIVLLSSMSNRATLSEATVPIYAS
jgi:hypothetical protein